MGIGLRMGALAMVLGAFGCARSGPPAPVVYASDVRSPAIESSPSIPPAPILDTKTSPGFKPVRWAPLPTVSKTPIAAEPSEPEPQAAVSARPGRIASSQAAHVRVGRGDTLYAISRRHRIPLRALIEANGLKPPYRLATGRSLRIPETRYYVVARGDTVYALGRRFGLAPSRIIRANRIKNRGLQLYPGQKLLIPGAGKFPETEIAAARGAKPPRPGQPSLAAKPRSAAHSRVALAAPPIAERAPQAAKPKATPEPPAETRHASIPKPPPAVKSKPKAKAQLRRAAKPASLPPRGPGKFLWPVTGRLLSSYGAKGNGLYNDGINIAAGTGTPVRAVEAGVIAYAGNELKGYGNLLLIRHSGGWVSAYAHNSKILVSKGQVVRRGQTVAKVGQSGAVDKPQLHFELRRGPQAVNPLAHLEKIENASKL